MEVAELILPRIFEDFSVYVDVKEDMIPGTYAYYDINSSELHILDSVYDAAVQGSPRHRFTIAHEVAHVLLLYNETIVVARSENEYKAFTDPEWQANELAAELLAPHDAIKYMTEDTICRVYKVSKQVAQIQKSKK